MKKIPNREKNNKTRKSLDDLFMKGRRNIIERDCVSEITDDSWMNAINRSQEQYKKKSHIRDRDSKEALIEQYAAQNISSRLCKTTAKKRLERDQPQQQLLQYQDHMNLSGAKTGRDIQRRSSRINSSSSRKYKNKEQRHEQQGTTGARKITSKQQNRNGKTPKIDEELKNLEEVVQKLSLELELTHSKLRKTNQHLADVIAKYQPGVNPNGNFEKRRIKQAKSHTL